MSKRVISSFFAPASVKRAKVVPDDQAQSADDATVHRVNHPSYPIKLPDGFPFPLECNSSYKTIENLPHLSLHYYSPLFPASTAASLFHFLLDEFPWYRVTYEVRGMTINTPRYTTVFGLDETHVFEGGDGPVLEVATGLPPKKPMRCRPRPLPGCLKQLKDLMERETGEQFNFCLLNYYRDGKDSISYHSDDEHFLGPLPAIASLSLGSSRDFLMRLKDDHTVKYKASLKSGDMILMRQETQSKWDHSIPKRAGNVAGRMNLTFRNAKSRAGTENYYNYNVHSGPYHRWDKVTKVMVKGSDFETRTTVPNPPVTETCRAQELLPDQPAPKLEHKPSFDLAAQIAAIDKAVAAAEHGDPKHRAS